LTLLVLLVGRQERHHASKNDILTMVIQVELEFHFAPLPPPSSLAAKVQDGV